VDCNGERVGGMKFVNLDLGLAPWQGAKPKQREILYDDDGPGSG
jgi:hypothetical protein